MNNKYYLAILFIPLLIACQNSSNLVVGKDDPNINIYLDNKFNTQKPLRIETEAEIFQLSDQMRKMVHKKLHRKLSIKEKTHALLEHIFNEEQISLTYQSNANLTASQTYHQKVANCMSLTIMAYALADEAGLKVSFREVDVPEYWIRNGNYNLLAGHVNLRILNIDKQNVLIRPSYHDDVFTIDFDPYVAKRKLPSRPVTKAKLLAMFYNNKAAEAMVNQNNLLAYQYLKSATQADNTFAPAWGNLGILYKLAGSSKEAEIAYIRAINLQVDNLNALSNLALLLNEQNREVEAALIEKHIHQLRVKNPYYHALLGNEAFYNRSYQEASKHYKKAISLDDSQNEFYFGLAKTYYMQGKLLLAKREMKNAVGRTNNTQRKNQYIAKLSAINAE